MCAERLERGGCTDLSYLLSATGGQLSFHVSRAYCLSVQQVTLASPPSCIHHIAMENTNDGPCHSKEHTLKRCRCPRIATNATDVAVWVHAEQAVPPRALKFANSVAMSSTIIG